MTKRLEEIKKRLADSNKDCGCHSMRTCTDKALEYQDHYDVDIPYLISRLESAERVIEYYSKGMVCLDSQGNNIEVLDNGAMARDWLMVNHWGNRSYLCSGVKSEEFHK